MAGSHRFSDIWLGHPTPQSHYSYQGIYAPHCGKEYRGNTRVTRVSRCFPYDLLGMPHERDIEFKIELQSGTAPVA
jgi:hypothetical protein